MQQYRYDSRAPCLNNDGSPPWMGSQTRSLQLRMPSPAASVRSAVTAPAQPFLDRPNAHHPNKTPMEHGTNSSLTGLDVHLAPSGHAARAHFNIERSFQDDSWSALHLRNSNAGDGRISIHDASMGFKSFHAGPGSVGSAAPVSDSGFFSQSAFSTDAGRINRPRLPSSLARSRSSMNVMSTQGDGSGLIHMHSDQKSQISSRNEKRASELQCQDCQEILKCKSDFKCVSATQKGHGY